ncbi:MAG: hypothetical protein U1F76_06685 [Candidatus Competibacteraceae bacterium]
MMNQTYWNETIETLPRAELEAYQTHQLAVHLELAYQHSNYYHETFEKVKVRPADFNSLVDLKKFPFVDKKVERERQLVKPLLGDMTAVEEREVVFVSASSDSTGVPTLGDFRKRSYL